MLGEARKYPSVGKFPTPGYRNESFDFKIHPMVAYLHLGLVCTWRMSVPIDILDESASPSPER